MVNKEQKMEILKEYFTDSNGRISLKGLDFGYTEVDLSGIQAKVIDNSSQNAFETIKNYAQDSKDINNAGQSADKIINIFQKANLIEEYSQEYKKKLT